MRHLFSWHFNRKITIYIEFFILLQTKNKNLNITWNVLAQTPNKLDKYIRTRDDNLARSTNTFSEQFIRP